MTSNRITINGQQYDSPEAMPPDVRRLYEEAMRTVRPSLASGQSGGRTQVFTGRAGQLGEHRPQVGSDSVGGYAEPCGR